MLQVQFNRLNTLKTYAVAARSGQALRSTWQDAPHVWKSLLKERGPCWI